jgi:hypothetical protein
MADLTIPVDIMNGVVDIMEEVGKSIFLVQDVESGWIDENDKTKGRTPVPSSKTVQSFFYDFADDEVDGSLVQSGDRKVILSLKDTGISEVTTAFYVREGTVRWEIVRTKPIEVSGVIATVIAHIRRA